MYKERKIIMEEKNNTFTVINDKGEQIECEILFTFDSDETNKSYIVYTDNTKDEIGNIKVYASIYDPKSLGDNKMALDPIETDKEWNIIETILESLQDEANKNKEGDGK